MNEKLIQALDEISDRQITEAANWKRRRARLWVRAAAAMLALVVLLSLFRPEAPAVEAAQLVYPAEYAPRLRPNEEDYADLERYQEDLSDYRNWQRSQREAADAAMARLDDFWADSFRELMTGKENAVWSPVNAYISLAVLAQTASGSTRQEILDALGADSIETLQTDVQAVWERIWADDEMTQRYLANSLWLDGSVSYRQENLDILGQRYYSSVHWTNLNNGSADEEIRAWMDQQTRGILGDLSPAVPAAAGPRVLAIASTLYVNDTWFEGFDPDHNREGIFHAPGGDVDCTYMFADLDATYYARGEDHTAVALSTRGESSFWMILPDEGTRVSDLLDSGDYLETVLAPDPERRKVQLTMPKFEIYSSASLKDGLKDMGIRRGFSIFGGDFSETLDAGLKPVYVSDITQTARIIVNETGIRAGSGTYIEMISMGLDEPLRVVLDRPFLFVLTLGDIPLFAGVVAEP